MKLTRFEKRWLLVLFDAILPSGASARLPVGARDTDLAPFVDDVFENAPLQALLGVRAATWLITFAPLLVIGRFATMGRLKQPDRARVLERMSTSRFYVIRELPALLKMLATMGFCGLPAVQRQVGIDVPDSDAPPWSTR